MFMSDVIAPVNNVICLECITFLFKTCYGKLPESDLLIVRRLFLY